MWKYVELKYSLCVRVQCTGWCLTWRLCWVPCCRCLVWPSMTTWDGCLPQVTFSDPTELWHTECIYLSLLLYDNMRWVFASGNILRSHRTMTHRLYLFIFVIVWQHEMVFASGNILRSHRIMTHRLYLFIFVIVKSYYFESRLFVYSICARWFFLVVALTDCLHVCAGVQLFYQWQEICYWFMYGSVQSFFRLRLETSGFTNLFCVGVKCGIVCLLCKVIPTPYFSRLLKQVYFYPEVANNI